MFYKVVLSIAISYSDLPTFPSVSRKGLSAVNNNLFLSKIVPYTQTEISSGWKNKKNA